MNRVPYGLKAEPKPAAFPTEIGANVKKTVYEKKNAIRWTTVPTWADVSLNPAVSDLIDLMVDMAYRRLTAVELPSTPIEPEKK